MIPCSVAKKGAEVAQQVTERLRLNEAAAHIQLSLRLQEDPMILRRTLLAGVAAISIAALCLAPPSLNAQPAGAVAIDNDDIGGVVTGPGGPEAGVWVIAETRDLPVRYIKSVVTDDRGRFLVPDLPPASYTVWARRYGLVDSAKATTRPGQHLSITATPAPNE